jgi:hypothetical protein
MTVRFHQNREIWLVGTLIKIVLLRVKLDWSTLPLWRNQRGRGKTKSLISDNRYRKAYSYFEIRFYTGSGRRTPPLKISSPCGTVTQSGEEKKRHGEIESIERNWDSVVSVYEGHRTETWGCQDPSQTEFRQFCLVWINKITRGDPWVGWAGVVFCKLTVLYYCTWICSSWCVCWQELWCSQAKRLQELHDTLANHTGEVRYVVFLTS